MSSDTIGHARRPMTPVGLIGIVMLALIAMSVLCSCDSGKERSIAGDWTVAQASTGEELFTFSDDGSGQANIVYDGVTYTGGLERLGRLDSGTVYLMDRPGYEDTGTVFYDYKSVRIQVPDGGGESLAGVWKVQINYVYDDRSFYHSLYADFSKDGTATIYMGDENSRMFSEGWTLESDDLSGDTPGVMDATWRKEGSSGGTTTYNVDCGGSTFKVTLGTL